MNYEHEEYSFCFIFAENVPKQWTEHNIYSMSEILIYLLGAPAEFSTIRKWPFIRKDLVFAIMMDNEVRFILYESRLTSYRYQKFSDQQLFNSWNSFLGMPTGIIGFIQMELRHVILGIYIIITILVFIKFVCCTLIITLLIFEQTILYKTVPGGVEHDK